MIRKLLDELYYIYFIVSFKFSCWLGEGKGIPFSGYSSRAAITKKAMDFVWHNKVEGDYLEFGVAKGVSFIPAFHLAQMRGLRSMRFYAFDSFRGLPEIKGIDAQGFKHFKEGNYAVNHNNFIRIIKKKGVQLKRVIIVPGWFDETLADKNKQKLPLKKTAIVWIDCDLYESTVPV